jgi:hypothetical protein
MEKSAQHPGRQRTEKGQPKNLRKLSLIAPVKAAKMAAKRNNRLPVSGVVSREGARPQRIRAPSIKLPASNNKHPASSPLPTSRPPDLPTSSKRSERTVKQSPKIQLSDQRYLPTPLHIPTEDNKENEVAATPSSTGTDARRYLHFLL